MRRPRSVERYDLIAPAGAGGMGEVFLARARGPAGFERRVAVKRVSGRAEDRARLETLLAREARLAVRLDHPNVVRVLDLVREGDSFYLVMEWVPGVDLRRLRDVVARPLTPIEAVGIGVQLLDGLRAAHSFRDPDTGEESPILHCDVSPQNVLLSSSGLVKLSDFGVALADTEPVALRGAGKIRYMAPEVLEGAAPDARADLYAAAVVVYELLAGGPVFDGIDTARALEQKRAGPRPIRDVRADVPPALDAVLVRALDPVPEERHPNAAALAVALRSALGVSREELDRAVAEVVGSLDVPTPRAERSAMEPTATLPAGGSLLDRVGTPSAETVRRRPERTERARRGWLFAAAGVAVGTLVIVAAVVGFRLLSPRATTPRDVAAPEAASRETAGTDEAWRELLPSLPPPRGERIAVVAFDGEEAGPRAQYLVGLTPRYVADRLDAVEGVETLRLFGTADALVRAMETAPRPAVASALGASLLVSGRVTTRDRPSVALELHSLGDGRVLARVELQARPETLLSRIDAWLEEARGGADLGPPPDALARRDPVLLSRWYEAMEVLQQERFADAVPMLRDLEREAPDEDAIRLALVVAHWWLSSPSGVTDDVLGRVEASPATAGDVPFLRSLLAQDPCRALEKLGPEEGRTASVWVEYLRAEAEHHCGRVDEAERRFLTIVERVPGFHLADHHPRARAALRRNRELLSRLTLRYRLYDALSNHADLAEVEALVALRGYDEAIAVADTGSRRVVRPTTLPLQIAWAELLAGRVEHAHELVADMIRGVTSRVASTADLSPGSLAWDIEALFGLPSPSPEPRATEPPPTRPPHLEARAQAELEIGSHFLEKRVRRSSPAPSKRPFPQSTRRVLVLADLVVPGGREPRAEDLTREADLAALARALGALRGGDGPAAVGEARRALSLLPDGRAWPVLQRTLVLALRAAGDEDGASAACDEMLHPPVYSPLWSTSARICGAPHLP